MLCGPADLIEQAPDPQYSYSPWCFVGLQTDRAAYPQQGSHRRRGPPAEGEAGRGGGGVQGIGAQVRRACCAELLSYKQPTQLRLR